MDFGDLNQPDMVQFHCVSTHAVHLQPAPTTHDRRHFSHLSRGELGFCVCVCVCVRVCFASVLHSGRVFGSQVPILKLHEAKMRKSKPWLALLGPAPGYREQGPGKGYSQG